MRSALIVTGASLSAGLRAGGRNCGSCACAAAMQKSKAKTGANGRIGDFTEGKGKVCFLNAKIAHFRFYGNRKTFWSGHLR